jgi:hypothetical protein
MCDCDEGVILHVEFWRVLAGKANVMEAKFFKLGRGR